MEDWKFEFEWLKLRHKVKEQFGRKDLPDTNALLFLAGIRVLGQLQRSFTKEEKQDLMHIAVCELLSSEGYYSFKGLDQDGWPHYDMLRPVDISGVKDQERLLQEKLIDYFKNVYDEEE
jgi:hypothetical protein